MTQQNVGVAVLDIMGRNALATAPIPIQAGWERGYCKTGATIIFGGKAPNRGACVLLCLLHPDCRSVSYAGVDSDCMGASVCPRPLSFYNSPFERHYTLSLPQGGAACEQAEAEANAASAEVAAAVGHYTGDGPGVGLGQLCSSITPAAAGMIARNLPETMCSSGSHGVWTLAAAEAISWPAAARGCLRRCARCARCHFITVSPTHSLCMWHQVCSSSAQVAGEDTAAAKRAPQRAPQAPPTTAQPGPASACGFRSGRVLRREQLRGKATMALVAIVD